MNEEDARNENGPGSAGPDKEYRSEDRYSAYFSPGDMPSPGMKNGEGEEAAGWRKNREELETQYRNDPRFSILFDQEAKAVERFVRQKRRQKYIKVAGIRLTPKRILILLGFAIVILVCVGACFFYAFKDIGKYRHYARASALYEAGDYEGARELFIKVISEDPNKEEAVAAMADIYRHFGDWANEAFFRQRLMRLNPLNPDYAADFMNAAFRRSWRIPNCRRKKARCIWSPRFSPHICRAARRFTLRGNANAAIISPPRKPDVSPSYC